MRPIRGAFFGHENGGCAMTACCSAEVEPNEPLDKYVVDNWAAAKYGNAYVMGFIDAWDGRDKQPASRAGKSVPTTGAIGTASVRRFCSLGRHSERRTPMTPERLDELRERARKLQSDLNWLADEFAYFADQATDVDTARDLMKWIPLRVWTFLTDVSTADRQVNKLAPLSLAVPAIHRTQSTGALSPTTRK